MAVTFGANTTANINNAASSTSFSFTSNGSPLYVRIGYWRDGSSVSTVTFNGVALTRVAQSAASNGDDMCEIWRLASPAATTANIVVDWGAGVTGQSGRIAAGHAAGQDGTTPEGSTSVGQSAANAANTGSRAISGAATGDLFIGVCCNGNGATMTWAFTGGTDVTGTGAANDEFDAASGGEGMSGDKASDAVTAATVSWSGNTSWAFAGIVLKTAGAGGGGVVVPKFQFQYLRRRR